MAEPEMRVVPANEATADQLDVIFGTRGEPARCRCQWFKSQQKEFRATPIEERTEAHYAQTECGNPEASSTSRLVAFLDDEPVGWCAVEPRTAYPRLLSSRSTIPWAGRNEDRADGDVWSVTCFVTRTGFRRRGVSRALARASVGFAQDRGARALEGYPMITTPDTKVTWGELFVGSRGIFADAGFTEVSRPTKRRVVMRIDF
ncbi:hypothetical protein SAMN04489806_0953 [Paramicrobacterium humi]|uniref:N-acetyltransferase domain-containing protein n=1 Tax=Paramicrobacterium humi TaxID=640635 RepID=A0A1H4K1E0_9MICO|nr:GNAT family N-acetyltransferase [Microbacterium humi]SEB51898.1 hypothetical protein SAMN04489806_0953 [Microbacterium humi]